MENSNPGTDINPNVMFNYNLETTFDVIIKCNDSQNHASTERLEVDIIDNDRVVFTNLPGIIIQDKNHIPPPRKPRGFSRQSYRSLT